ncbi:type III-A CRISPR-associated protein Cas10/Csm1 [Eggerthellaceae bacterium zg-887]|uniref:type III-A CRISPR-associated protein Cas10/Csm1 n=1 Tax=Xiamenia xianingshaonis TaxID=2682776 RepID=UPI0019DAB861|nr:type III-A CRISPR-associated protein Cas10/Csm1 [Xiamenia xianingshaonis]NHM16480.1 type III-A CRISPR-associated protein Cas10/Csm1 [Xiamenia xianingshaonis]
MRVWGICRRWHQDVDGHGRIEVLETEQTEAISRKRGDILIDKTPLYFGALLHDVGKVVIRGSSAKGTHFQLGASFLADEIAPLNSDYESEEGRRVIEQVRYHHAGEIRSAGDLADDSLAFVTYFADNISAGMDRKEEGAEGQAFGFDWSANLRKVFNILNGHSDDNVVEHEDYNALRERLKRCLVDTKICSSEVDSLLNLLEATTSTVPSSTNTSELMDISLYDHAKTTAGIAACVYDYLNDCGISNYRKALFDAKEASSYCEKPMFLLCSCDMSGIQSFIYNISGSGALKQLRARSLYLEVLLEHVIDELLRRLGLCRANLLYAGGGHAYLLLPNTDGVKAALLSFWEEVNAWLVDRYRTDLYMASAWVECSAYDLKNEGDDKQRYPNLYRRLSEKLSEVKASRYSAEVIRGLNFGVAGNYDHSRECSECHRSDILVGDESKKCPLCASLGLISNDLVKRDVFVVIPNQEGNDGELSKSFDLPFGCRLLMYSRDEYLSKKPKAVRIYTKQWDMGEKLATHVWMGDYTAPTSEDRFKSYSEQGVTLEPGSGIKRLGVLRADVDDLGAAFVSGFPAEKLSISRTATFSRALSYFFKNKINDVLEEGGYQVQIIYSGGDDLFIVGNWSDVIYAAIGIRQALDEFTGNGSLTISAGIGMFDEKYPIARMAAETGKLEDAAKMYVDEANPKKRKNAVALWSDQMVFGWDELISVVMPRVQELRELFGENEKGKAFIYKMISLLRNFNDVSSAPRLAYLLARSFEANGANGSGACKRFYDWAWDKEERRCLIAALEWYVYSIRERG